MSDSTEKLIVLRATPGRDATASEIARSRGEFRRQPHLTTTSIEVEVPAAPALQAAEPARTTPTRPACDTQYGRARMHH
jgi:hypothetical protein